MDGYNNGFSVVFRYVRTFDKKKNILKIIEK